MGFLFSFLCALFFAVSNISLKKGMRLSEKDNGIFLTMCINIIVLSIAFLLYRLLAQNPSPPTITGVLFFSIAGFLTTFFGRTMLFSGIRRIGPSPAVAIKNSQPIFTLIFAIFILQERLGLYPWIGILMIFLGLFIQGYHQFSIPRKDLNKIGFIFSLLAACAFGIGQGVRKQAIISFNDPFAGALIGAGVAIVIVLIIEARKKTLAETIHRNFYSFNKYYIITGIGTSFAVLSFFIALWYTKVAYISAIVAIEPILTILLSSIFLKAEEEFSRPLIISALFILLGAGTIALTG